MGKYKREKCTWKTERHAVVSRLHPDSVEKKKRFPLLSFFPKEGFLAQPVIGLTFNILSCPFWWISTLRADYLVAVTSSEKLCVCLINCKLLRSIAKCLHFTIFYIWCCWFVRIATKLKCEEFTVSWKSPWDDEIVTGIVLSDLRLWLRSVRLCFQIWDCDWDL